MREVTSREIRAAQQGTRPRNRNFRKNHREFRRNPLVYEVGGCQISAGQRLRLLRCGSDHSRVPIQLSKPFRNLSNSGDCLSSSSVWGMVVGYFCSQETVSHLLHSPGRLAFFPRVFSGPSYFLDFNQPLHSVVTCSGPRIVLRPHPARGRG